MSAVLKPADWISPEEYLEGERFAEVRHEFVDGRVYAMAGASDDHNRIAGNIFGELRERLRGRPCEPFINDMKVKIPPRFAEVFYYPDVLVACDPTDNARYYRERPSFLFEVLSPETENTDRREKAIAYRQIQSVEAYVLVEQQRVAATVLRRAEEGWTVEPLEGPEAVLKLESLGVEIRLRRFYERTSLLKSGIHSA
ncbi:MAG: Uma2 family endonuclease [Verrucomicrobia bacterium]|nr:Uma2 family endonuclease [Verrucomicrobiota bacterium]